MKLKDKETGAILDDCKISLKNKWGAMAFDQPKTLKELVERFEDVEEPKRTWFIDTCVPNYIDYGDNPITDHCYDHLKELGFCFETEEEAEKAVEKLKAWKRLKDKGFEFEGIKQDYTRFYQQHPVKDGRKYLQFTKAEDENWLEENWADLTLLFGGEE